MTGLDFAKILQPVYDLNADQPGALVTVSAPPGSGKTFGVLTYLCRRIVEDSSFRAYFVATKKINLHPNEFRKMLVDQYELRNGSFKSQSEQERYVYQTMAVLRSLEESVGAILQGQADIPPVFRSGKLTRALEQLTIYHQRHHQQPEQMMEEGQIKDYQNLRQAYMAFKQLLIQAVAAELKLDLPLSRQGQTQVCQYVAHADTPAAHYLNRYFPEINLHRHQLVLLTWSKFTRSHPAFFGTSSINLASTDSLGNAMIVLDEIDEMKGILVNQIIEEALKMPLDCLAFFRELYSAMNHPQKSRSKQIMTILRCNQQFSQLKKQTNKLENAYKLTMDYKTVDALAQTNFIFNVSSLTITSSHAWWSQDDPDNKRVVLTKVRPEVSKNLHFYGMIGELHRLLKTLIRLMNAWGGSYQDEVNSHRTDLDNQLRLEDAVRTIGDALWLSRETQRTVDRLIQQPEVKQANFVPTRFADRCGQHLQKYGLQLTSLTDSDAHLNRTQIEVVNVQTTPEKFLLKLVKRGIVVGLSATVNVETVLNNFDFNFLREQLGERLIDGMKNLPEEALSEFDVSRRYREKEGKVRVLEVTTQSAICESGTCLRQLIRQRVPDFRLSKEQQSWLKELEQDVKQTMKKVHQQFQDSQNPDYYAFIQKRYLDLFDSFIYFLGHPQIPTFLGLQSILPKREEDYQSLQMSGKFIENVWQGLTQVLCSVETIQPRLCMIAKKLSPNQDPIETQVATALKLPAKEATRVYLLSAYATLGVGQNLHYPIGKLERGRTLAIAPKSARTSDQRFKMVDIGGVYLGQVTNVFTQIPAVATQQNRFQWIKGFYELLGLVDNGEISLAEVDRYARFQGQGIPVRQFRQTLSYVGAHTRIILQAVGRLDRAFNKLPETTVILGTEVADYFNVTMLADYQLGSVAQAIRDYQRQKKHLILTPDQIQGIHWLERTCETQRAVDEMVKHLQKKEEAGRQYRRYRETLIKYPTMTTHQYNMRQTKPEFAYLQRNDTAYRVQREGENFDFKQDHSGNMEVSAERADLPIIDRNPGLRRLFNENQWPLSWQATDYVMNPAQFDSYLGILGEKCGQYLIEKFWPVRLQPLTLPNYELFDFQTKEHVLVDFKHWRQPHRRNVGDERRHVKSKLTEIQQRDPGKNWRVLIVNLLEPVGTRQFHSQKLRDDRIMEVPFLLNRKGEFAVTMADQREIGDFLNG